MSQDYLEYTITKKNGQKIRGRLYCPENTEQEVPLAVFLHGFGSCMAELSHYGPRFAGSRIALFLFDFCGGGPESTSDGSMWDMSVQTEYEDLEAVLDFLKAKLHIKSVFLMGESQGGLLAAMAAAKMSSFVKGLILWYPAFNLHEHMKMLAGGRPPENRYLWDFPLGIRGQRDLLSLDIRKAVSGYTGDVLILHGDQDEIVPCEWSVSFERVYREVRLIIIKDAGHGFDGEDSLSAGRYTIDFIKQHI